jgi:hypothetical protein
VLIRLANPSALNISGCGGQVVTVNGAPLNYMSRVAIAVSKGLAVRQKITSPDIRTHNEGRNRSPEPVSLTMEAVLAKLS